MFCANCGNKIPDEAKFCASCGGKTEPVQSNYTASEKSTPMRPAPPPQVQTAPHYQQAYVQPQPASYSGQPGTLALSIGQYIGMFLLMCIPILNIILLFIWAFGSSVNLNKKNFARAALILCAIMLILWIVAGGIIRDSLSSIIGDYY